MKELTKYNILFVLIITTLTACGGGKTSTPNTNTGGENSSNEGGQNGGDTGGSTSTGNNTPDKLKSGYAKIFYNYSGYSLTSPSLAINETGEIVFSGQDDARIYLSDGEYTVKFSKPHQFEGYLDLAINKKTNRLYLIDKNKQVWTVNINGFYVNPNNPALSGGGLPDGKKAIFTKFDLLSILPTLNNEGDVYTGGYPRKVDIDDKGNIYLLEGRSILKIAPDKKVTATRVHLGGSAYNDIVDIAVKNDGAVLFTDEEYKLSNFNKKGIVSFLAGDKKGYKDGMGRSALFGALGSIAVDSKGNAFVMDIGNNLVRKITPSGVVSTYAGGGDKQLSLYSEDTPKLKIKINGLFYADNAGIMIDKNDNLYFSNLHGKIFKVAP